MSIERCDAFSKLACPVDGTSLSFWSDDWLISESGRKYPVVQGVPVLLRDDVDPTIGIAQESITWARRWADGDRPDPFFLETLGISSEQREALRDMLTSKGHELSEPVVSFLIAATNGLLYQHLVGKLEIPLLPDFGMTSLRPGAELLDVGCSWGRWSMAAAHRGYMPIGIDPSLGAVLAAKRFARRIGINFRGVVGDARYLPFLTNSFSAAYSYSVLQHFSRDDATSALSEIRRVLVPGGCFRVQMASAFGLRSFQHMAMRGFRTTRGFEVRYWTPFQLLRTFKNFFNDVDLEVDCYFGLGLQATDRSQYGLGGRMVLLASECLRKASKVLVPLRYLADSVFISGKAPYHKVKGS